MHMNPCTHVHAHTKMHVVSVQQRNMPSKHVPAPGSIANKTTTATLRHNLKSLTELIMLAKSAALIRINI